MTVAEIIDILKTHDQAAICVLCDPSATETRAACALGRSEVCAVELYAEDSARAMWFELFDDHFESAGFKVPGVLLGSL